MQCWTFANKVTFAVLREPPEQLEHHGCTELCCVGILNLRTNVYSLSASTCIHAHKYKLMDTFS